MTLKLRGTSRSVAVVLAAVTWLCACKVGAGSQPVPPVGTQGSQGSAQAEAHTPTSAHIKFDGSEALEHAARQVEFGPRPAGSESARRTAEYISQHLSDNGWAVSKQDFTYSGTNLQNVIGEKGSGDDIFLIGAHYDTRRRADRDAAYPDAAITGANDGASGVAVLLELARTLDVEKVHGRVQLVFFDAEDDGGLDGWDWILGSRYFVEQVTERPTYAIIVDMVGDSDQNIYLDGNSDPTLRDNIWSVADSLGYGAYFVPVVRYSMLDDHTPFNQAGIPAIDIIDFDYPYWHTTHDTLDKISAESLERVGRVVEEFLESGGEYPQD